MTTRPKDIQRKPLWTIYYPRFILRNFGLLSGFETTVPFRPPLLFFVGVSLDIHGILRIENFMWFFHFTQ
jgi:hypothetical protein